MNNSLIPYATTFFKYLITSLIGLIIALYISDIDLNARPTQTNLNIDTAIQSLQTALHLDPDNSQAFSLLANAYEIIGDEEASIQARYDAIHANNESQALYKNLARTYAQDGDDIAQVWRMAVRNNPSLEWPYQELAKFHKNQKNYKEIVSTWQQAIRQNPNKSWAWLGLGQFYISTKEYTKAISIYKQAVQGGQQDSSIYFALAQLLRRQNQHLDAIDAYQQAISRDPSNAIYYSRIGLSLIQTQQIELAITHMESALQLDPGQKNHEFVQNLYQKHLTDNQYTDSYQRIVNANPTDTIARDTFLQRLLTEGRCDTAVEYADLTSQSLATAEGYIKAASIYRQCNHEETVEPAYQAAIEIAPYDPTGYFQLGTYYFDLNRFQEAEKLLAQALELAYRPQTYREIQKFYLQRLAPNQARLTLFNLLQKAKPTLFQPYEDLIQQYQAIGQPQQEIPILRIAAEAMPYDEQLQFRLAEVLYQAGNFDEAVKFYTLAVGKQPNNQTYQLQLGRAQIRTGDINSGSDTLQQALSQEPNQKTYEFVRQTYYDYIPWPDAQSYINGASLARWEERSVAYNAAANWYMNYGYPDAGLEAYTQAMQADRENPTYPLAAGKIYLEQGKFDAAKPLLIQAIALDSTSESFKQIQTAYLNRWTSREALQKLSELLEDAESPTKQSYAILAQLAQNLGQHQRAIAVWQQAIAIWPADNELQIQLAQAQEQAGDFTSAITAYERAIELAPEDVESHLAFGTSLLMDSRYEEGTEILRKALLRQANNKNYQRIRDAYQQYILPIEADDLDETSSDIKVLWLYQEEIARIRWPNPSQAYLQLAKWFTDNGQTDGAAYAYMRMIEEAPANPVAYLALGQLQFDNGETEQAAENFVQAIKYGTNHKTYRAIQNFYLQRQSVEQSLETLQSLLAEAQPTIKQPYLDLIRQYQSQGLEGRSIPVLQLALHAFGLDILPQDADLYYRLAEALYKQEEIDAAVGAYRRAATMQPQNQTWQINFSRALLASGHTEDGIRRLKTVLANSPQPRYYRQIVDAIHEAMAWPDSQPYQLEIAQIYWTQDRQASRLTAYQWLAQWYQQKGLLDGAIATYQTAVDRQFNDPATYLELGKLYFEANELAAAQSNFERAVALDETPSAFDTVQKLYMSSLLPEQALLNLFYLVEQAQPTIIEPYDQLAMLYTTLGDSSQQTSIYQAAITAMPNSAQALFQLAQAQTDEPEEEIKLYRRALALQPNNQSYGLELGTSLLEAGETEIAANVLEQALRVEPSLSLYETVRSLYADVLSVPDASPYQEKLALIQWPQAAEAYDNLARWYVQQGQTELTISAYEKAISADPERLDLYVALGKFHFERNEQQEAVSLFTQAIAADQSVASFQAIQNIYTNNLAPSATFSSLLYLLTEAKPTIIKPYNQLIQQYEAVGLTPPTTTILTVAAEAMPEESTVHFKLAEALYEDDQFEKAIESYNTSLALAPQNQFYRLALGKALLADEQIKEGVNTLHNALRQRISNRAYNYVQETYQQVLGWPRAKEYQQQAALIRWSTLERAYPRLATWYTSVEQIDAALDTYEQLLAIQPDNQNIYKSLATLYLDQAMCPEASYHATQFATLADDFNSYRNLANVYSVCGPREAVSTAYQQSMSRLVQQEGRRRKPRNIVDRALQFYRPELTVTEVVNNLYDAILQTDIEKSFAYSQLGWYLETTNQATRALPLYEKAVESEPTNANNHFTLARLYHELGQTEKSLPEYQRALALGQRDSSTYLRYGSALVQLGQYEQGQTILENGLALEKSDWGLNYVLTQYLENIPPDSALPYIVGAIDSLPVSNTENYIEIYMQPVRFYLENGDVDIAVALLEKAATMNGRYSWPYVKLSYVYRGLNQFPLAVDAMQKASIADPRDAWIHLTLGNMLRRQGRLEGALYELRQATQLAPEEAWYHIYLGHGLIDNEEIDKGSLALRKGLELESTEEAFAYVDKLYSEHLTSGQIIAMYEQVLSQNPEDLIAQRYLSSWIEVRDNPTLESEDSATIESSGSNSPNEESSEGEPSTNESSS